MPIRNLTAAPRLPRLGTIVKGAKREEGKFPKDLDYFRFRTDDANVQAALDAIFPKPPAEIIVRFPYAAMRRVWDYNMEEWSGSGLIHRCDGEVMSLWRTPGGELSREPKPCPYATGERERTSRDPGCKPRGRLSVLLPDLLERGIVGTFTVLTGSWNDIRNITDALEAVAEWGLSDLRSIPFTLSRKPKELHYTDGKGKERKVTKSLLYLSPDAEWLSSMMAHYRVMATLSDLPPDAVIIDDTNYFREQASHLDNLAEDDEDYADEAPASGDVEDHGYRYNDGGFPDDEDDGSLEEDEPAEEAPEDVPWRSAFWPWAVQYLEYQNVASDVHVIYDWGKLARHIRPHLAEYDSLADAQADFIRAVNAYREAPADEAPAEAAEDAPHWLTDRAAVKELNEVVANCYRAFAPEESRSRFGGTQYVRMLFRVPDGEEPDDRIPDKQTVFLAITRSFYERLCRTLAEQTGVSYRFEDILAHMAQRAEETGKKDLSRRAAYIREWFDAALERAEAAAEEPKLGVEEIPF